ncbi:MAG TPA: murein biosynthesis integral membrane protein MurJ [Dehalococcoidia bacterium]|nr:murein biosynthesis integral membrane protein MurJ [Dehalococcoidia bacterium]
MAVRRGLAASTLTVFGLTLLASALGYLRESGVAAIFGASAETDAYLVAFFIPNVLFLVLVWGTLTQALVPTFVEYLTTERREEAWHVASSVLNLLTPLLLALVVAATAGAPLVVRGLAPGLDPEVARSAEDLTRLLMPIMLFLSLSAVVAALLNSVGRFTVPALSPVVGTLMAIVSLFTLGRWIGIYGLALGTLAGSVAQLLVQLPWLARSGFRYSFVFDFRHPGVRRIAFLCGPVALYVALAHASVAVERVIASGLETGSISMLNYAMRIFTMSAAFPVSLGIVLFPTFSALAATDSWQRLSRQVVRGVNIVIVVITPLSVGFIVAALPLIRLLFERGRFGDQEASTTALILAFFSLGMLPTAATQIFIRALYSARDVVTPAFAEGVNLLLYIPVSIGLARLFEAPGLAVARALTFYVVAAIVFYRLRRRVPLWQGAAEWAHALKPLPAGAFTGLVLGLAVSPAVGALVGHDSFPAQAVTVSLLAAAGGLLYVPACLLLRVEGSEHVFAASRRITTLTRGALTAKSADRREVAGDA